MTAPHPLVAFLTAELDREEQVAWAATALTGRWLVGEDKAAGPGPLVFDVSGSYGDGQPVRWDDNVLIADPESLNRAIDVERERAAHIARHDPRSTLARVEAARRILDLHQPAEPCSRCSSPGDPPDCTTCSTGWDEIGDHGEHLGHQIEWPCATLRALAAGHRYAEGFQTEWLDEAEVER